MPDPNTATTLQAPSPPPTANIPAKKAQKGSAKTKTLSPTEVSEGMAKAQKRDEENEKTNMILVKVPPGRIINRVKEGGKTYINVNLKEKIEKGWDTKLEVLEEEKS